MQTLGDVFAQHADFYRERYVPFMLEEGFITSVEESEYAEGIDGFKRLGAAEVEALPRDYQTLPERGRTRHSLPSRGRPGALLGSSAHRAGALEAGAAELLAAAGSTLSTDDAVPFSGRRWRRHPRVLGWGEGLRRQPLRQAVGPGPVAPAILLDHVRKRSRAPLALRRHTPRTELGA